MLIPSHPVYKKTCLFQRGSLSVVKDHQNWHVHARSSLPATNWKYSNSVLFALFGYLLFVFCASDYPVVSRPVVRPVMRRGRGCSKIALRCDFNIKSRRKAAILTRVEWFVDKKRTKVETVRGSNGELMENTYGFKAGTTVSLKGFWDEYLIDRAT